MTLAVVRNLASPRQFRTEQDEEDFEQELVDQYALSMAAAGLSDSHIRSTRAAVIDFARSLDGPLWTAGCGDADRHLDGLRREGRVRSTVYGRALAIARFYDFVLSRYQGDIHALTGTVAEQPVDEFNRPKNPARQEARIPPSDDEVAALFSLWGRSLPDARKYLPAARGYFAASLWRRLGLRINETVMLDVRDWRPDLGTHGKLHVRHGKGSGGRGPKPRLVPAINDAGRLIDWWLGDVRHQFGPGWADPDAPMLPSERHDRDLGRNSRAGQDALRSGLTAAAETWLPAWAGRLTPHVLRHYCASSLYLGGMDLKAVQELLGHEWLTTTTKYVHVRSEHIELAWAQANKRTEERLTGGGP